MGRQRESVSGWGSRGWEGKGARGSWEGLVVGHGGAGARVFLASPLRPQHRPSQVANLLRDAGAVEWQRAEVRLGARTTRRTFGMGM